MRRLFTSKNGVYSRVAFMGTLLSNASICRAAFNRVNRENSQKDNLSIQKSRPVGRDIKHYPLQGSRQSEATDQEKQ